jgi:cardiolipin synthase (CMP-forming)
LLIHIPNILTLVRIVLVPCIIFLILYDTRTTDVIGAVLFCIASVTDFLDGYLARILGVTSNFGEFLDPIADKLLVISSIFALTSIERINGLQLIPAILILYREFIVSGLREFLLSINSSLPVSKSSKLKTIVQLLAINFLIIHNSAPWGLPAHHIGVIMLWISSMLTIKTGATYLRISLGTIKNNGN